MCTLAKRSLALANWACTSCLSSVQPAHELQPSQTPRPKHNKRCQFLENSVIKPPFGIMSRDVTVIHPNRCSAHTTKYKYNMLNFQTKLQMLMLLRHLRLQASKPWILCQDLGVETCSEMTMKLRHLPRCCRDGTVVRK